MTCGITERTSYHPIFNCTSYQNDIFKDWLVLLLVVWQLSPRKNNWYCTTFSSSSGRDWKRNESRTPFDINKQAGTKSNEEWQGMASEWGRDTIHLLHSSTESPQQPHRIESSSVHFATNCVNKLTKILPLSRDCGRWFESFKEYGQRPKVVSRRDEVKGRMNKCCDRIKSGKPGFNPW